jgi:hypothetical protein
MEMERGEKLVKGICESLLKAFAKNHPYYKDI